MQDDIGSAVKIRLHDKLGDILSHRVQRSHAIHWASNLRYLTFDDGGDEGYTNADDGALDSDYINASALTESDLQERLVRELGTGHCRLCEIKGSQPIQLETIIDGEKKVFEYSGGCVHVCQRTCVECRRIPLFPNGRQVKRFRIRRLQQASLRVCDHFVAVSYRWSDARKTAEQQPYQVVEEDGTVRDARAANEILDRIVAFARENGFRMIWIDQVRSYYSSTQQRRLTIFLIGMH